jgi:hypothetical protein
MGHAYISCGVQPCRALSICTAPQLPKALAQTARASTKPAADESQTRVRPGRSGSSSKSPRRRRLAGAGA